MADERNYYVICADGCKFEGMTKEQILAAIAEATGATVTNIDSAFITKIKELNKGETLRFWKGTTAEYNALPQKYDDCQYIKTDDTTFKDIEDQIKNFGDEIESWQDALTEVKEAAKTKQTYIKVGNIGTLRCKRVGDIVNLMGRLTWQPAGAEIGGGWVGFGCDEELPYVEGEDDNYYSVAVEYTDGVATWQGTAIVRLANEKNKIYLKCDEMGLTKAIYHINISFIFGWVG